MKKILSTFIFMALFAILFSSNAGANMLVNSSFATASIYGPLTTLTGSAVPGQSAAASWTTWNNSAATTNTELLASTLPSDTNNMIHVKTGGKYNGIVQVISPINTGPATVLSSAWVYVLQGQVGIGTGNDGNTTLDTLSTGTGYWQFLQANNGISPANEFIVYSASLGGAEFYVDATNVAVSTTGVPEPSTLLLLGSGILGVGGLGFVRRRFNI